MLWQLKHCIHCIYLLGQANYVFSKKGVVSLSNRRLIKKSKTFGLYFEGFMFHFKCVLFALGSYFDISMVYKALSPFFWSLVRFLLEVFLSKIVKIFTMRKYRPSMAPSRQPSATRNQRHMSIEVERVCIQSIINIQLWATRTKC